MTGARPTALIADDEPLLREALERQLQAVWPELEIVARARNGREAVALFESTQPDICFLDVHMPGLSGIEAARQIGRAAHLVFVTAFQDYAVQAFEQGVLDYLVKPVEPARLAETASRLKARLGAQEPALNTEALLQALARKLTQDAAPAPLRWIRAQVGRTIRLIAVDDVDYLRSDAKYTRIAWRGDGGQPAEALVRLPLKDFIDQLDPNQFAQVHRSTLVNLRAVSRIVPGDNDTAVIQLKDRLETLQVSRSYLHLFRQM